MSAPHPDSPASADISDGERRILLALGRLESRIVDAHASLDVLLARTALIEARIENLIEHAPGLPRGICPICNLGSGHADDCPMGRDAGS